MTINGYRCLTCGLDKITALTTEELTSEWPTAWGPRPLPDRFTDEYQRLHQYASKLREDMLNAQADALVVVEQEMGERVLEAVGQAARRLGIPSADMEKARAKFVPAETPLLPNIYDELEAEAEPVVTPSGETIAYLPLSRIAEIVREREEKIAEAAKG